MEKVYYKENSKKKYCLKHFIKRYKHEPTIADINSVGFCEKCWDELDKNKGN